MRKTWKALTAAVAGVAMVMTGVGTASAAPTEADRKQVVTAYTDTDVVEFLVFGSGELAEANPELVQQLGLKSEEAPAATVEALTAELLKADPQFHTHVTAAIVSGNPYSIRNGLQSFSRTMEKVTSKSSSADVSTNCVVWGVVNLFVAIELVVAGALVVVVAYQPAGDDSRFTQDEIAASLTALR